MLAYHRKKTIYQRLSYDAARYQRSEHNSQSWHEQGLQIKDVSLLTHYPID
jgi:hypothetical protein